MRKRLKAKQRQNRVQNRENERLSKIQKANIFGHILILLQQQQSENMRIPILELANEFNGIFREEQQSDWKRFCNKSLMKAAEFGFLNVVKYLCNVLHDNNADIVSASWAMTDAARNGHLEVVKYLVGRGDVNINDCHSFALRTAAHHGHLDVVIFLCEHGADVSAYSHQVLSEAAYNGHTNILQYLLHNHVFTLRSKNEALQSAARHGRLGPVKLLVANGADVHDDDELAVRFAAMNDHYHVVKFLLSKTNTTVSVEYSTAVGTSLNWLFIEASSSTSSSVADWTNAFFVAARCNYFDAVKMFVQFCDIVDEKYETFVRTQDMLMCECIAKVEEINNNKNLHAIALLVIKYKLQCPSSSLILSKMQ